MSHLPEKVDKTYTYTSSVLPQHNLHTSYVPNLVPTTVNLAPVTTTVNPTY